MLKLKYLFENYDLAKECLKLYDHSEKYLEKMLSYYRISSNAIYPFYKLNCEGVCFLRLSPVEEKAPAEVASEIHFITWLLEQGFAVMKPYPMKNGSLWDVVTTEWGTYNVSCFEAVPGKTLENTDGTTEIAFGYGRTLGWLHNLSARYPFAGERRSHIELLEEIQDRFVRYHAPEKLMRAHAEVSAELEKLEKSAETYGLIHYDFEPDNVLYDAQSGSFGVIDPDDAIRCWFALDAARAIDAMDDVVEEAQTGDAISAFLDGYRSVRPFTEAQMDTLPLMRRLVMLQEYATILHVLSDPPSEEPEWMTEVKGRLNYTLSRIENRI